VPFASGLIAKRRSLICARPARFPDASASVCSLASVSAPQIEVEGCRRAHIKLRAAIAELTDDQVSLPSLLPDWTVGQVL
jgi:hypothetical protein